MRKHGLMAEARRQYVEMFLRDLIKRGKAESKTGWIKATRGRNFKAAGGKNGY